jgi:LCCL domain
MNATQRIARQMSRVLVVAAVSAGACAATLPAHAQAPAAPGSMVNYRDKVGQSFDFTVQAGPGGSVWGTDVYTDDSRLAAVVIHAGLLRDGQQGVIRVTMLAGQTSYQGSARNGITSASYGSWGGSYRVAAVGTGTTTTTPPTTATGSFHAVWATDLGLYLGLVQSGNQVRGYYWWEGNWYALLTGTVNGRVLSGRWDAQVADGEFTFTLTPDGKGFDARATGLYGMVELYFKGGLYSPWK